ncbi:hypothetical protein EXV95_04290 [Acidovorax sp. JMULE5]|uniref:hypothetical protein n=1 Tax=Acidovorax sp. JMULE5 TaxID=2518343 RepID=UPI0015A377E6|nr:hypothetical protein [Acidovorax sp. JMULE5]QLA79930.1 hypothetical protein EXV95_04290 [Acidovorax sp. JMULE5]
MDIKVNQPLGPDQTQQQPRKVPMRFRTRTALAGGRRPGVAFFGSAEHWSVVDGLRLTLADGSSHDAVHLEFTLENGCRLSFGQIVALAGDFYALAHKPISDQADKPAAFRETFATLDKADPQEVKKILGIMEEEFQAIANAIAKGEDPHEAYARNSDHWDLQYNVATGGADKKIYPYDTSLWGRYMWIASFNWDHFGAHAHDVCRAGLQVAMETAASASAHQGLHRSNGLLKAYAYLAFASHYLTDGFASGHLRTPRRHLHDFQSSQTHSIDFAPDACAKAMHDEDGFNGLWVSNAAGDHWIAYGDGRYFDTVNAANRNVMRAALRAAIADVYRAFTDGKAVAAPTYLRLLPKLPLDPQATDNFSPLFVAKPGEALARVRVPTANPNSREWMRAGILGVAPWWVLAAELNGALRPPKIGVPPGKGQATGPNTGSGSATNWIVQARLLERQGKPLTTQSSPAIAEFKGERWVCVKQGNQFLIGRHRTQWTDFQLLKVSGDPVQTSTPATLVVHGDVLHCFYADFEGCLQWLQWNGDRWMKHGTVQVNGSAAKTDRAPCAVSLPNARHLVLFFKGYRSSDLYYAWRFEKETKWLGNTPVQTGQGYAAMTDEQPCAACTREGAFVYFRAHGGRSVYSIWVSDNDPARNFYFYGNEPIRLIDKSVAWTSAAVAAAAQPTDSQVLLVVPHDDNALRSITQQTLGDTTQRQYLPGDVDAADGEQLLSNITPALALIDGRYWMLSVEPEGHQVMLSFGQP